MTFGCHLDTIFKFKVIADKLTKKFSDDDLHIWHMQSHAKSLAQIESDWTIREDVSSLISNISCT